MRKIILALVILICFVANLAAQGGVFVILDTNTSRGITFSQEGGNEQTVFGGMAIKSPGRLRLLKGVKASVVFEDVRIELEGPAMHDLEQLGTEIRNRHSSTFMSRFWSFISNAIKDTDTPETIEQSHRRYLSNAKAGISGFGDRVYPIEAPKFLSGPFSASKVNFRWHAVAHPNGYRFVIWQGEPTQPVLAASVMEEALTIDLRQILLEQDVPAFWQVRALQADSTWLESRPIPFSLSTDILETFTTQLESDEDYQSLSPSEKEIFRLYQLEEQELYLSAYLAYREKMDNAAEIPIFRHLFTSFLLRMNALQEAQNLME